mmetsp:Transcript_4284/g.9235  ORF Transcript_4284/g.9235 Transcript_4284/m.9235 type:complete len:484 (+) Transcript_4284:220-1671(+)|eukprot:CAMPEP_0119490768 /NCGR_PEP_ID=MMETSP1344-20130328/15838_1 /TAXON_ID=236787 /ORGANISM="Florenciella parvula, Strain CCMP2471" /LENGTH=483 /DNA_ID=CAMNT_0007525963 /DNA_START=204 /DNA_END=1655 /DNA_ORIENTATION=+
MGGGASKKDTNEATVGHRTHRIQSIKGELKVESLPEGQDGRQKKRRNSLVLESKLFYGDAMKWSECEIEEEIGRGNFGVVYRAHCGMGRERKRVAIKEVFFEKGNSEVERQQFQDFANEVKILKLVQHPNIVRFLGAVQDRPHYCFVLEFAEGSVGTFLTMVGKSKVKVTWGLLFGIALGAAKAIAYLHGMTPQVLHRDIKAENLLLTNDFTVKVTDFGLSRIVHESAKKKYMTMCGSIQWLAPEVIRGDRYDSSIDVYSYGITIWELFNFEKPFKNHDPINLPYLVTVKNLRPDLRKHVPELLRGFMARSWDDDADMRPPFDDIVRFLESCSDYIDMEQLVDTNTEYVEKEDAALVSLAPGGDEDDEGQASETASPSSPKHKKVPGGLNSVGEGEEQEGDAIPPGQHPDVYQTGTSSRRRISRLDSQEVRKFKEQILQQDGDNVTLTPDITAVRSLKDPADAPPPADAQVAAVPVGASMPGA